jgi:hypothetical protein
LRGSTIPPSTSCRLGASSTGSGTSNPAHVVADGSDGQGWGRGHGTLGVVRRPLRCSQ